MWNVTPMSYVGDLEGAEWLIFFLTKGMAEFFRV